MIFSIESYCCFYFKSYFYKRNFFEINLKTKWKLILTPRLLQNSFEKEFLEYFQKRFCNKKNEKKKKKKKNRKWLEKYKVRNK